MAKDDPRDAETSSSHEQPRRVRLPGFVGENEIGLGDLIKKATGYWGVRACGGCERRAAALNRWITFTRGR